MKKAFFFALTFLLLFSCMSDAEVALKEKELELKEREIALKEKELSLNQQEEKPTHVDDKSHSDENVEEKSISDKKDMKSVEEQANQESPSSSAPNDPYSGDLQPSQEEETYDSPFSGSGSGFDSDDGTDTGEGVQGFGGSEGSRSEVRVRLTNLRSNPVTPNNQRCKIALKLTIDASGKVYEAHVIRANTTTTNQQLINEVISLVKKEVTYKEKPGAPNETAFYTVTIQPG